LADLAESASEEYGKDPVRQRKMIGEIEVK
jgi:hypothetical protein